MGEELVIMNNELTFLDRINKSNYNYSNGDNLCLILP